MKYTLFVALALSMSVSAIPRYRRQAPSADAIQNGLDAKALNQKFQTLGADAACTVGEQACIAEKFAICTANSKFTVEGCAPGTKCAAIPNVFGRGTSVACTTQADIDQRFAATVDPNAQAAPPAADTSAAATPPTATNAAPPAGGNTDNANKGGAATEDLQKSLTLDNSLVVKALAQDGNPQAGQVKSLTSVNNFINFCGTVPNLPPMNGNQIKTGSCNAMPLGVIAAATNIPSAKFQFPLNGDTSLKANTPFTIKLKVNNLDVGNFVNAATNYFSAPQHLNAAGNVIGHTHVVAQALTAIDDTTPIDPNVFDFFKGVNGEAGADGLLTADVTKGLPAGVYRLSSINAAENHQPILVAVNQHGLIDDTVYFTVNP